MPDYKAMRLTDADELLKNYQDICKGVACYECSFCVHEEPYAWCRLDNFIKNVEIIDAVPVKRGKWINDKGLYKCSACNELWTVGWAICIPIKQMYKEVRYCPHCGAKMEEDND